MAHYGSSGFATKATLNLILGVFLKLLGFFVVMYTYTDINPIKARQAEESLRQQFNVSVSLLREEGKGDSPHIQPQALQKEGRSFKAIREQLKTQLDFLSSRYLADSDRLMLSVPAEYVVTLDDNPPKSPRFVPILVTTLGQQRGENSTYAVEIIIAGNDRAELTRQVSILVQKMIALDYPAELLTIGYRESDAPPAVDFYVTQKMGAGL